MTYVHRILLVVATFVTAPAMAMSEVQLWTSAGVRHRPSKKVRLTFTQHVRFDQDISRLESVMPELAASWAIERWLRLGGGYRFSMESNKKGELEPAHRLHVQSQFGGDLGPVELGYRLRFQEGLESDDELETRHTFRNRIGLDIDTDTLVTPGLSAELFTRMWDKEPVEQKKVRFSTGLEIRPHKAHEIELQYRYQLPLDDPDDPREHIVGFEYQYRIPRKKKE